MVSIKACLVLCVFALTTSTAYAQDATITATRPKLRSADHIKRQTQAVDASSAVNAQVGAAIGANLASKVIPGVVNNAQNDPQTAALGAQLFGDIGAGVGGGIGVGVGSGLANKVVGSPDDPNAGFIKKKIASFGQNIASSIGAGVGAGIGGGVGAGLANKLIQGGSTETANANAQATAKDMTARGASAGMAGTGSGLISRLGVKIGSGIGGFANKKIVSAIGVATPSTPAPQAMPQAMPQGMSQGMPQAMPQTMPQGAAPGPVAGGGVTQGEADFNSLTGVRGDVVAGVVPGTQLNDQGTQQQQ